MSRRDLKNTFCSPLRGEQVALSQHPRFSDGIQMQQREAFTPDGKNIFTISPATCRGDAHPGCPATPCRRKRRIITTSARRRGRRPRRWMAHAQVIAPDAPTAIGMGERAKRGGEWRTDIANVSRTWRLGPAAALPGQIWPQQPWCACLLAQAPAGLVPEWQNTLNDSAQQQVSGACWRGH